MAKPVENPGASLDGLLVAMAERVTLSPRERIKVLQLLGLRPEWPPGELADALAALLATSPGELERLRATLRPLLGPGAAVPGTRGPEGPGPKPPGAWARWWSWKGVPLAALLLAAGTLGAFAYFPRPRVVLCDEGQGPSCVVYTNGTRAFKVGGDGMAPSFGKQTIRVVKRPKLGELHPEGEVIKGEVITFTAKGKAGRDSFAYELQHWSGTVQGELELTVQEPPSTPPATGDDGPDHVGRTRTRVYSVPRFVGMPAILPDDWLPFWPLVHSLTAGCALALYGFYLAWARRRRKDDPPDWDPLSPERFRPSEIGGRPPAWLLPRDLDQLAEVPIFLETDEESGRLDIRATVAGSARALRPELRFERRRETLGILLLVDDDAAALAWNPLPKELVQGLEERGLEVEVVRFAGTLTRLHGRGETRLELGDFAEEKDRLLVLVVSDGAGLYADDVPALEQLADFPRAAWIDPREPRFWDDRTELVEELDIPVFPASREGIAAAFDGLLSPRGEGSPYSVAELRRRGLRVRPQGDLRSNVEEILGDALPWAASAAMIQPVTVGLAEKLRERFYPALPAMAVGRLFALPDTRASAAGLRFADPVLALLRQGFPQLHTASKEVEVLQFLLAELEAVRPAQSEKRPGLALLAWSALYERVRLELKPDDAAKKLARLSRTPLGSAVRADLAKLERPWREGDAGDGEVLPLRLAPQTHEAKAILDGLARLGAGKNPEPRRLRRRELGGLAILGMTFLLSLWPLIGAWMESAPGIDFRLREIGSQASSELDPVWLGVAWGGGWMMTRKTENSSGYSRWQEDGYPVLSLIGASRQETQQWSGRDGRSGVVEVSYRREIQALPCQQTDQTLGLTTLLCPAQDAGIPLAGELELPSWRTKVGAGKSTLALSIGIEIDSAGSSASAFEPLRDALLASSSVDRLYRIDSKADLEKALAAIQRDLGPWARETQAVWWSAGEVPGEIRAFGDLLDKQADTVRFPSQARLRADGSLVAQRASNLKGPVRLAADFQHELRQASQLASKLGMLQILALIAAEDIPLESMEGIRVLSFYPAGGESLSTWSRAVLAKAAVQLAQEPELSIAVLGFGPGEGVAEGQQLAEVVAGHLTTTLGIDRLRITARGAQTRALDEAVVYLLSGTGRITVPSERTFTLLATSDLAVRAPGDSGAVDIGSFARFRSLRQQVESQVGEILVLHAGGAVKRDSADPIVGVTVAHELLSRLDGSDNPDPVLVVGFEHPEKLSQRHIVEAVTMEDFTTLDQRSPLQNSTLRKLGGVGVGVINLMPSGDGVYTRTAAEFERIKEQVERLRRDGAEVVIALSYNAVAEDLVLLEILDSLGDSAYAPDLIFNGGVAGDAPQVVSRGGRFVVKASAANGEAAKIRVRVRLNERPVVEPEIVPLPAAPPAPDMEMRVRPWEESSNEVLARTEVPLDLTDAALRSGENAFGNWVADRMRSAFTKVPLDAAFFNAGTLRLDRRLAAGAEITQRDLEGLVPFKSSLRLLRISGATLRQVIEHSLQLRGTGEWLQMSGLAIRENEPSADRTYPQLEIYVVEEGGETDEQRRFRPLRDDEILRVVTLDFLVSPAAGYTMLDSKQVQEQVEIDLKELILGNLSNSRVIAPRVENRICLLGSSERCLVPEEARALWSSGAQRP